MGTRLFSVMSIISMLLFASCTSTRDIAYFKNANDTTYNNKQVLGTSEAPLQPHDFISISISSANADASAMFNPFATDVDKTVAKTGVEKGRSQPFVGYLISNEGYIEMPILGKIMAAGITKMQLKEQLTKSILSKKLLVDPLVDIRFLNFEVTILGEVGTPTVISVPSEKISLIKALGMAGDITIYGKKDKVLLIREENGIRRTRHINLNSADFLNSEYYYLKPNDVVYVEPNKTKIAMTGRAQQLLPIVLTGVSLVFIVFDKVIK